MSAMQNVQMKSSSTDVSEAIFASDLEKIAKPIGTFAGSPTFIVKMRNGMSVAADTGDQGGGQN
jgi:hypothetical protein